MMYRHFVYPVLCGGVFLMKGAFKMKKKLALIMAFGLVTGLALTSCGGTTAGSNEQSEEAVETADTEEPDAETEPDTGDASLDDPRNQDDIGTDEILVVSFGTSYNDSRRETIGAIEQAIETAAAEIPSPDGNPWSVRRAFTSQIIIDHVNERDGEKIDNVTEALDRAADNGVQNLVIVPTHLMNGHEFNDLQDELGTYADAFGSIVISKPLLSDDADFTAVAEAVTSELSDYNDGETAIVLMGHGTDADSNGVYEKMQGVLSDMGEKNFFIGTVESTPSLDDVVEMVNGGDYKRVVLKPLMVVAGDHANNDMAGEDDDSWRSVFINEGYDVECVLKGLGQSEAVQQLYVQHMRAALGQ